jgi:hypothetical protein
MIGHRGLISEDDMSTSEAKPDAAPEESDLSIDSVTLARLIEEVQNDDVKVERSYDRTHNRHNR